MIFGISQKEINEEELVEFITKQTKVKRKDVLEMKKLLIPMLLGGLLFTSGCSQVKETTFKPLNYGFLQMGEVIQPTLIQPNTATVSRNSYSACSAKY